MVSRALRRFSVTGLTLILVMGVFVQAALASTSATANPTSVEFGKVAVGSTGYQTITITNTGTEDLWFNGVALNPPFFTDFANSTCLNPAGILVGANCTIVLTLSPTKAGRYSVTFQVQLSPLSAQSQIFLVPVTGSGRGCPATNGASCK